MHYLFRFSLNGLICVVLFFQSGCQSPRTGVEKKLATLGQAYEEDVLRLGNLEKRSLVWDEAWEMIESENLDLRQARDDVTRSQEQIERVFLDLLPTLSISTSLRKALTELGTVDKNDLSLNIFSAINVPGLVSMRTRYYTAVLTKLRSEWTLEMKRRELSANLYVQFIRYEGLNLRRDNLEQSQLWGQSSSLESRLQTNPEMIERDQQLFAIKLEANAQQESLAELLGAYTYEWQLDSTTLPELNYTDHPLELTKADSVGVLVRQLQATDLEAIRLRTLGIKLQYWPDVSASLSSPPIYSYSGGQSTNWSADDVALNAFVPLRIDTQLRTTYQLRDARRQAELTNERMRLEITRQVQKYLLASEELGLIQKQLRVAEVRIEALEQTPRGLSLEEWRAQLRNSILLSEQRASLRLQKARIETLFWIVDESRWPRLAETTEATEANEDA